MELRIGETHLVLLQGDLTRQNTDVIVNAANTTLLGGGGVDGAIHRAGGPVILEECRAIAARQGGCGATGEAVITTGGSLRARHVIHTVGPVWSDGRHGEERLLRSAYRKSLALAAARGLRSVAFPSISTGAYRFPIAQAAAVAIDEVARFLTDEFHEIQGVRFVLFSAGDLAAYETAARRLPAR